MKQLTKRQQEVFDFIKSFIREHGWPPTYREIAKHFCLAQPAAFGHVRALQFKGAIEFTDGEARGIRVKEPLQIHRAKKGTPGGTIEKGDYVYVKDGRVTGITREVK